MHSTIRRVIVLEAWAFSAIDTKAGSHARLFILDFMARMGRFGSGLYKSSEVFRDITPANYPIFNAVSQAR